MTGEGVRARVLLNDPTTDHIYLKVTPNLFTAEKLHLFESMDMYTSLIKCAKFMENGERLHNLSWRIINKSLLKDRDINKSKTRDGVRSLYGVLSPQPGATGAREAQGARAQGVGAPGGGARAGEARDGPAPASRMFYIEKTPSPETSDHTPGSEARRGASLFAAGNGGGHDARAGAQASSVLATSGGLNKDRSLFTQKPGGLHGMVEASRAQPHHNLFISSGEDDSDWDSISDDSDLYDNDDYEDEYYEKQWDKLMFTKSKIRGEHGSPAETEQPPDDLGHSGEIKRSLLSGLFLNQMTRPAAPATANLNAIRSNGTSPTLSRRVSGLATMETSNVVVMGAVTPTSSFKGAASGLEKLAAENGAAQHGGALQPPAKPASRRASISSIVSDSTRERYLCESNAPLTAHTILPTALSTHMFPPNNVHQQRLARGAVPVNQQAVPSRKTSIEIPCKTWNKGLLKTRMELSEEENFGRGFTKRQ
ncbi:AaceriAER429Wp [[Ashbya] aceris (nom. inval.)]|nr:AaceriAER429Wp [[Ashbya] aceris (nom. inval.)]